MRRVRRITAVGAMLAAAVTLAACGGGGDGDGGSSGSADTVSVESVGNTGDVLVNPNGAALYTPEQEQGGKILCTGQCTSIWVPITIAKGQTPIGPDEISADLGTVKRPDGKTQVTFDGGPLYSFSEEGPDQVTGDGFADAFNGDRFVWHVATPSGAGASSDSTTTSGGGSGYSY